MSEKHTQILRVRIRKPAAAVFAAMTDSAQLTKWFAEHALFDAGKKEFRFWGRYTPETPSEADSACPISRLEEAKLLEFKWNLRGATTTATLELEQSENGTLVTMVHSDIPSRPDTHYSLTDFWYGALENLRGWVERQATGLFADYSRIPKSKVELAAEIDAAPEQVFDALMNPSKVDRVFMGKSEIEPREGGKYTYGWPEDGPLKILELKPNEKLTLEWHYKDEERTVLTWELKGSGGRTHLTLVHSGFAADRDMGDYNAGWISFLGMIKGMIETGDAWKAPEKLGVGHGVV